MLSSRPRALCLSFSFKVLTRKLERRAPSVRGLVRVEKVRTQGNLASSHRIDPSFRPPFQRPWPPGRGTACVGVKHTRSLGFLRVGTPNTPTPTPTSNQSKSRSLALSLSLSARLAPPRGSRPEGRATSKAPWVRKGAPCFPLIPPPLPRSYAFLRSRFPSLCCEPTLTSDMPLLPLWAACVFLIATRPFMLACYAYDLMLSLSVSLLLSLSLSLSVSLSHTGSVSPRDGRRRSEVESIGPCGRGCDLVTAAVSTTPDRHTFFRSQKELLGTTAAWNLEQVLHAPAQVLQRPTHLQTSECYTSSSVNNSLQGTSWAGLIKIPTEKAGRAAPQESSTLDPCDFGPADTVAVAKPGCFGRGLRHEIAWVPRSVLE